MFYVSGAWDLRRGALRGDQFGLALYSFQLFRLQVDARVVLRSRGGCSLISFLSRIQAGARDSRALHNLCASITFTFLPWLYAIKSFTYGLGVRRCRYIFVPSLVHLSRECISFGIDRWPLRSLLMTAKDGFIQFHCFFRTILVHVRSLFWSRLVVQIASGTALLLIQHVHLSALSRRLRYLLRTYFIVMKSLGLVDYGLKLHLELICLSYLAFSDCAIFLFSILLGKLCTHDYFAAT